mmetsp:Transcript_9097/g.21185  ORF Transcript_9097/g.21185 Transcript_9097/m.21185 type:complete len:166 (+) Transcript_9097:5-502(+)
MPPLLASLRLPPSSMASSRSVSLGIHRLVAAVLPRAGATRAFLGAPGVSRSFCAQKPGEDAPEASKAEPVVEEVDENIDYYRILGVPKSSDLGRIKQAYLRKAAFWHPDRNSHTPDLAKKKFEQVSEALQVLSNDETRRQFDSGTFQRAVLKKFLASKKDIRAGY